MSTADWTVLDIEGVTEAGKRAATKVAREYQGIAERDDLQQDALVLMAQRPDIVRQYVTDGELGLLQHWVWCRLVDAVRTLANRSNRSSSYEVLMDGEA